MTMCINNKNKVNDYNNRQELTTNDSIADRIFDILSNVSMYDDVHFLISADEMSGALIPLIKEASMNSRWIACVLYDNEYEGEYLVSYIENELFIEKRINDYGETLLSEPNTLYISDECLANFSCVNCEKIIII